MSKHPLLREWLEMKHPEALPALDTLEASAGAPGVKYARDRALDARWVSEEMTPELAAVEVARLRSAGRFASAVRGPGGVRIYVDWSHETTKNPGSV